MRIKMSVSILAVLGLLFVTLFVAVLPVSACKYSCTPGFWKQPQHFGFWVGYDPNQTVGSVFSYAALYGLENDTLLEALDYGGGPDLEGAAKILLRASVAWLLNSAYNSDLGGDTWEYNEWTTDWIVDWVNINLSYGVRAILIEKAEVLDVYNNVGCPLEGQEW
jgi:hypothetical protein